MFRAFIFNDMRNANVRDLLLLSHGPGTPEKFIDLKDNHFCSFSLICQTFPINYKHCRSELSLTSAHWHLCSQMSFAQMENSFQSFEGKKRK